MASSCDSLDGVLAGELLRDLRGLVELRAELRADLLDQALVGLGNLELALGLAGLLSQLCQRAA